MAERKCFTFLRSYYEQLRIIKDPGQRLQMYEALADYALNRIKPDFGSGQYSELQQMFWTGVLPLLDLAWLKFDAGTLGGAPEGNTNARKRKTTKKQAENKQKQPRPSLEKEQFGKPNCEYKEGEGEYDDSPAPALEDVLRYYSSTHGTEVDRRIATKFINYYAARGWKMGSVMMSDWRAAFDSWCDREIEFNNKHTVNNENDRPTCNQLDAELGQLQEYAAAEARLAGEI